MPSAGDRDSLRRALLRAGAWLFAFGLLTGLWAGVVLTGKVHVAFPRLALGAHLTAMLGGLWLIALALVARFSSLRPSRSTAPGLADRDLRVGELVASRSSHPPSACEASSTRGIP